MSTPLTAYPTSPTTPTPEIDEVVVITADSVTLVDNDDQRHEVKAYLLMAWSNVFRDMFESPLTNSEVPINADTETVVLFLEAMRGPFHTPTIASCDKLLDLADQYDCNQLRAVIFDKLSDSHRPVHVLMEPWELFGLASRHKKPGLARHALRHMDHAWRTNMNSLTPCSLVSKVFEKEYPDRITSPYIGGLLKVIFEHCPGRIDWPTIAAAFEPLG